MKRKYIYLFLLIISAIALAFAVITGLIYTKRTNQIKKITFERQKNVYFKRISDFDTQYEFVTAIDTFYVSKQYHPELDWKTIEKIDMDKSFDIVYTGSELVSLKNNSLTLFNIDFIKTKKAERDEIISESFNWFIGLCGFILFKLLLFFIAQKIQPWYRTKTEKNILQIPGIVKVKDEWFLYSYKNTEILLWYIFTISASQYGNRNHIRVYIPITAEQLVRPNNLLTEGIDGKVYCYFDYKLFTSKVNLKKLQAKIDSKFMKSV